MNKQLSLFDGARKRPVDNYANRGLSLERALERQHEEYREQGKALITRQYDPSVVVKFPLARIIGRAVVDYVGVLADGRCVAFDAKDCAGKRLELSRLQPHQAAYLAGVQCMGGLAGVLTRFEHARVYWVPYELWEAQRGLRAAREGNARKSIAEKDLGEELRVQGYDWMGVVQCQRG